VAFSGNLIVGDGTGAASSAVVRELQGGIVPTAAAVTVNADGLYKLNGQSESFGPLVITGGTVDAGAGLVSFAALTMTGGAITAAATGEVQFRGDATINASATGSSISGGRVQFLTVTRTFTIADGAAVNDLELASEVRQTTGTVGLTKAGAGTLLLSGSTSNTYTGPTTVTGGTLVLNKLGSAVAVAVPAALVINGGTVRHVVNDEITDAAAVTVNTGGALDLNGQPDTVGPMTITGGTVKTSGTNLGRVTAGNTSFNAASTLAMKLAGTGTSDRLTVNGTLTVGGTLQLSTTSAVAPGAAITLIDNDGTDAVAGTFANLPQGASLTVGGQSFTISYTGGTGNDVVLTRSGSSSPRVLGVQSNGGAAQRSMVTSLTVTFDGSVTLPTNAATAFTLTRIGGGAVTIGSATAQAVSGATVVTLSGFSGTEASSGGSLNDGRYTLTALAGQITANGQQLDGNGDGTAGDNFVFADSGQATGNQLFRFFGDINGDRFVNGADFALFRTAFGSSSSSANYNAALDVNGDGFVNGADFTLFRTNFGGGV
jgi:autotransporter-associated beta strand protein